MQTITSSWTSDHFLRIDHSSNKFIACIYFIIVRSLKWNDGHTILYTFFCNNYCEIWISKWITSIIVMTSKIDHKYQIYSGTHFDLNILMTLSFLLSLNRNEGNIFKRIHASLFYHKLCYNLQSITAKMLCRCKAVKQGICKRNSYNAECKNN